MNNTFHIQYSRGARRPGILQSAEAAMMLGFHSLSQNFPVVASEPEICTVHLQAGSILSVGEAADGILVTIPADCPPPEVARLLGDYLERTGRALDAQRAIAPTEDFSPSVPGDTGIQPPKRDWRKSYGLECLFDIGTFFRDQDGDQLADCCDFHVMVPQAPEDAVYCGILDLAYRMGMETTSYISPVFTTASCTGNVIRVIPEGRCAIRQDSETEVTISGSGASFARMCSCVCGAFPQEQPGMDLTEYLCTLAEGTAWETADGQLTAALLTRQEASERVFYADPALLHRKEQLGSLLSNVENRQALVPVFDKQYEFPWEIDVLKQILKEKLENAVKPGDQITVLAAVSENKAVRQTLCREVEAMFPGCQADILCAYKQGLSWVEEWVLPRLKDMDFSIPGAGITISFKPFLPKGITDWGEECGGAVPSYNGGVSGTAEKWLDLPIRFLQELYPIDDLLCLELGLQPEQVRFTSYDGPETYQLTAVAGEHQKIWHYQVPVVEQSYLRDFPNLGCVHPSVGFVKVCINGEPAIYETFLTDPEQIWNVYQQEVLPAARAYATEACGGNLNPAHQPFFAQLRLEATLSEPNEALPTREDLLSSLDALHEDLHFAGSDYFKNCGIASKDGRILDAPGLILPVIHQQEGAPQFRATLYRHSRKSPCSTAGGDIVCAPWGKHSVSIFIREIRYENQQLTYALQAEAPQPEKLSAFLSMYGRLLTDGKLEASHQLLPGRRFEFSVSGGDCISFTVPASPQAQQTLDIRDIDTPSDVLMGYEQYLAIIEQLKKVPALHVYPLSHSCQGRVIYGVEVASKRPGYLSRTKRISRNLSEMLTARHHANEVSSTNAAFLLIKALLTEEAYADLPEWLNLIIIPMLNVDGAAVHYELQKEHPTWKFHVARYNSLGKDFGHEWFVPDTIHTEALAHEKLWWRILPDIEVDNHGVPSHEWEQPFSGYTSPSFKGFWLPRALLYGYFWYVKDSAYRSNLQLDHRMEQVIADAVNADEEIARWNAQWKNRFETYAHSWMPGLFPADYYRGMINYWIAYPYTPRHTYDSVKYPWITTVCYTSEVADETAQGDYLALCAHTHFVHDQAILALLRQGRSVYRHEIIPRDNQVFFSLTRQRPALCPQVGDRSMV